MDHTVLCSFMCCVALLWSGAVHASPLFLNLSMEGSGTEEDGKSELLPSPSIFFNGVEDFQQTTVISNREKAKSIEHNFLTKVVDFLRENLFPILVITCLFVVIFIIICSAVVLSHRQKVNAYYPCSFPTKMYVDKADKTGGGNIFSSVPEKPQSSSIKEPFSSAQQLQEDILLASRNLRTPTKTAQREEKDEKSAEEKTSRQAIGEKEEISCVFEEDNPQQLVSDENKEKLSSRMSEDAALARHMEKSDPSSPDLAVKSEHQSGLETQDNMDKQEAEAVASDVVFISEEKTTF